MSTLAEVRLWDTRIGAVGLGDNERFATFEYDPLFLPSGIEVAPLEMPLAPDLYRFPGLAPETFHGLPGMLADSLPDRFGNALIDAWLARQGRTPDSFNAVERLCYIGRRGIGALEFAPSEGPDPAASHEIDVAALTELATEVLSDRAGLAASLAKPGRSTAMRDILAVGTSAGGARAKALIAWNPETDEIRSGQIEAGSGFQYWLLKFDGVGDKSREIGTPTGYGAIEFAYAQLAGRAGIEMMPSRLLTEGPRRHFMTRRFDRTAGGDKVHMQSLGAIAHFDFNLPGAHGYEQAIDVIFRLGLGADIAEEQYRRMVFNIVARNHDDHVKNIAYLMDRDGRWRLSPAFDVTFAYNPEGRWTSRHQMTVNGKAEGFTFADLQAVARVARLPRGRDRAILDEVIEAVAAWPTVAAELDIDPDRITAIAETHLLDWPGSRN